ncbi:hypothetical protein DOE76_09365 [Leifsonia sp. ku-ls]|nr:hypothetical protein DOE76_09365 [Leifsonia sp. ku-ls]
MLAAAFRDAYLSGDPVRLARVLAPDVLVVVDSGGVAGRPHGPADGLTAALTLLTVALGHPDGLGLEDCTVNGRPGLRASRGGRVVAVIALDGSPAIDRAWLVTNPDKLRRW